MPRNSATELSRGPEGRGSRASCSSAGELLPFFFAHCLGRELEPRVPLQKQVATSLLLKGSLFDEELLGAFSVPAPPEVGDVIEHGGKSYTVTDLVHEGADGYAELLDESARGDTLLIAIVEPLAMSQRRGGRRPG